MGTDYWCQVYETHIAQYCIFSNKLIIYLGQDLSLNKNTLQANLQTNVMAQSERTLKTGLIYVNKVNA